MPRNPERIDPLLSKINRVWKQYPDLRLTQLLLNVIPRPSGSVSSPWLYYFEDDELMQALDMYPPSSSEE